MALISILLSTIVLGQGPAISESPPPSESQPDPTSNKGDPYSSKDPPESHTTTGTIPLDNLLQGPAVFEIENLATIVHRNFDGSLEDIGPEPDYAAIGKLQLTDEQRNWYDSIHTQRLMAFDKAVRSHYGLILELAS